MSCLRQIQHENETDEQVAKYQLQDLGVVPGLPKVVKRSTIRPPNTGGKGKMSTINRNHVGAGTANSNSNTIAPEIGSPMSNLAVVDSTIPSSPSPSRIPASQSYTQVNPSSSPSLHERGIQSTSRIPLPQSRSTLRSPQTHLRSGIPIPKPRFPTLVNNPCHSPAISICATVATVSPQSSPIPEYEPDPESEPVFVPVVTMDREGNSSAHESIYSSASAMALSRYRASLPNNNMKMEARSTLDRETGQGHDLSRISSTTSYSSASSLARHRLYQARSQCQVQAQPMSGTTSTSSESEQALIWQPDPESTGFDPAENLWKEIEARLNRRPASVERERDERGQWVLTSRQKERRQAQAHDQEGILLSSSSPRHLIDGMMPIANTEMRKEESEFTISAYFDPDLSTPLISRPTVLTRRDSEREMEGTALFDMSAPLVISNFQTGHESEHGDGDRDRDRDGEGSVGKTPANTPLIHHETIQRVQRVRKSTSTLGIQSVGMGSGSGSRSSSKRTILNAEIAHSEIGSLMRSRSDSSTAVVDLNPSLRTSTSTAPSPPQTRGQAQTQSLISDYKDQRQSDEHGHSENMSPSPSHASFQSRSELGYHRPAGDFDIGMTRLDSHVQAALEELSDYRSIYPTTATTTMAGDRTPLVGDEDMHRSTGTESRYSDQQSLQYEHHRRYQYEAEDEDEEANTISDVEENESTPMPRPNPIPMSPTIPHSSKNGICPLETFGQMKGSERFDDVGLGMGMDLRLDSVYSLLPVVSPRLRIPIPFPAPVPGRVSSPLSMSETDDTPRSSTSTSNRTSSSECLTRSFSSDSSKSSRPLSIDTPPSSSSDSEGEGSIYKTHNLQDEDDIPLLSQPPPTINHKNERISFEQGQVVPDSRMDAVEDEEEEEMLTVTDLDTGHRVDLSIKRLDELELWRL